MIYKLDTLQDTDIISLGNQSENDAQTLEFDISAWLEKWPGGAVQIIYRRPDSPRIYPVLASKITIDSGILRWLVDRSVTAVSGHGYAVISYVQGAVERRTARVNTLVHAGLPPAGPAPDPIPDYVADLTQLSAQMQQTLIAGQAAQAAAEAAASAASNSVSDIMIQIDSRLEGISLAIDPSDGGLNLVYNY